MAIAKLDFARGQVVNPLDSIGDDLLKFGSSLHQQEKDRLAAERQNELLAMQKQEHQMKVDEQARQLAETEGYKKFVVGLSAPKEMAEASALYNQNNNPILQKQVNDMAFVPTDTPEDVVRKTKLQEDLGKFGSTMSAMPEFKETEYQKGKRILAEMGDKAPLAGIKQLREMEAAQIASDAAKSKDLTETAKHAQDNLLKLQIEAAKHGTGDTITTTNGTVLPIDGSKGKAYNPFSFGVKQTEDKVKNYEEGTKALTSRMDALGAGKAEDVKTGQRIMAMDALNKYAAEGYDPTDLAGVITTKFQKEPSFYEVWKDKQTGIILTPEELKPLEAKRTATATLDNMKLQEAQFASVLAQARNGGATGTEILKAYGPVYQNQIAKAEADKALLALTPEQRQAQATMSYLGKMMTPKIEATGDKAVKGNSAETVDVTNMVPKLRTIVDDTVDTVVDKHGGTHIAGVALATMGVAETGGDLNASGDGGTAKGLYQHRNERLDALKKFGKTDKVETIPHNTQTDFAVSELKSRAATKEFADAYKEGNPDAKFVSQWDELNSKKTAGEAAAYLSEYFEVAKGNSKNPNIVEARREEGARRAKMAEAMYANDYDEFGQNKRRIGKVEEEMIKSGPKALPGSTSTKPISYDPAVLKQESDNAEAKKEKDKYTKLLEKPIKEWSVADRRLALAKDSPLSEERGRVTLLDYIGDAPRILKKEVALKDDSKQDWDASSKTPEEGLTHANLDWVPAGKVLENIVTIGGKSIAPAIKSILSGPDIEALKRANDFNKIGIWRELRSRGLEVTDDMVNEILRQGKVLPR